MTRPPSQAVIEAVELSMRERLNLPGPMRRIFGDEVGDAVKVLLAQEVQAAAPEVARAAEAAALGAIAGDWLIERTYGLSDEGITGWPETNANAYRCAIEDAQSALRERADELTDTDDGSNRG